MKKALTKVQRNLHHCNAHGYRVDGAHEKMHGDCTGLYGDCTGLHGYCPDLYGDCSNLRGDCTGLYGNCTDLYGNLDRCGLTESERAAGVNLADLVAE
jgi:hypothetical protein